MKIQAKQFTCRLGWHPNPRSFFTTAVCPLLTATCNGDWRRLFRAFMSLPALISCSTTTDSSPKAAWWIARSPSLSCKTRHKYEIVIEAFLCGRHWGQMYIMNGLEITRKVVQILVFSSVLCLLYYGTQVKKLALTNINCEQLLLFPQILQASGNE